MKGKSRKNKSYLRIYDSVFRQYYHFFNCDNFSKYKTLLKKYLKITDDVNSGNGYCGGLYTYNFDDNSKKFCIWCDVGNLSVLVHEIQHCVFETLSYHGINHNSETDEIFSYYTEFLFSSIISSFKGVKFSL
jgi:hypothetical protein